MGNTHFLSHTQVMAEGSFKNVTKKSPILRQNVPESMVEMSYNGVEFESKIPEKDSAQPGTT